MSSSINDLANETMSLIFQYLPPNERVRIERVCRRWCFVSRELSWYNQKTFLLDGQELAQNFDLTFGKYISLIGRCGRHLHELKLKGMYSRKVFVGDQLWSYVSNLRHLCFDDTRTSSDSVKVIAAQLPNLKSVAFSDIDWSCSSNLNVFLSKAKLIFLRFPVDKFPERLTFSALPHTLRILNICARRTENFYSNRKTARIIEILQLAAIYCPALSVLMLPIEFQAGERILDEVGRFNRLFYLRLSLRISDASLFDAFLDRIGTQLKALLLETVDGKILQIIAKHCPNLEHISFDFYPCSNSFRHFSALQAVLKLPRLRSVSIGFIREISSKKSAALCAHILSMFRELVSREELEYLQISREFPLPMSFIAELCRRNSKISKISCRLSREYTQIDLDEFNTVLSKLADGTHRLITLNFFGFCPALIERNNIKVRLVKFREDIDQSLLHHFCAHSMNSFPSIWNMDE
ncbi:hypothetical protein niasHT_003796 [Heterodera trifolii]|uniref:F-box domain-containing protein n=1 Tax=Heterodera trifolii TaxID=157864 RepID=A0ABD2LUT6_9BILA